MERRRIKAGLALGEKQISERSLYLYLPTLRRLCRSCPREVNQHWCQLISATTLIGCSNPTQEVDPKVPQGADGVTDVGRFRCPLPATIILDNS